MKHYTYLAAMGFTFIGSIWLEVFLKVSVLKRIRRVLLTILPVGIAFVLWDRFAITQGHWRFDNAQVLPLNRIWGLPLEEYLFFIFVPLAAILTIEAVRAKDLLVAGIVLVAGSEPTANLEDLRALLPNTPVRMLPRLPNLERQTLANAGRALLQGD